MGYITAYVEVDFDDISDDDILDIITERLAKYKRRTDQKLYNYFIGQLKDTLQDDIPEINISEQPSIRDWLLQKTLDKLTDKYTLEELENLLDR